MTDLTNPEFWKGFREDAKWDSDLEHQMTKKGLDEWHEYEAAKCKDIVLNSTYDDYDWLRDQGVDG
jgi:hypothetical protein